MHALEAVAPEHPSIVISLNGTNLGGPEWIGAEKIVLDCKAPFQCLLVTNEVLKRGHVNLSFTSI